MQAIVPQQCRGVRSVHADDGAPVAHRRAHSGLAVRPPRYVLHRGDHGGSHQATVTSPARKTATQTHHHGMPNSIGMAPDDAGKSSAVPQEIRSCR